MLPRIESARYVSGCTVWLKFADGAEGELDLSAELRGDLFERLRNPENFSRVELHGELQSLTWPNGARFEPGFLRAALARRQTGDVPEANFLYADLREKYKHEDELINRRVSWLLQSQGFLLATYGLIANANFPRFPNSLSKIFSNPVFCSKLLCQLPQCSSSILYRRE